MFSLLRKIIGLALFFVFVSYALNYRVQGKPVRDYLTEVYRSPLVQELIRQGKGAVVGYLHKDVGDQPPQDQLNAKDRKELEKVLEKAKER